MVGPYVLLAYKMNNDERYTQHISAVLNLKISYR